MVKEKQITIRIQTLEALLRRIPSDHPKRVLIENEYSKRMVGYKGEKSLDYYLSFLGEDYYIFHDIRLKGETYYFQIDVLIIAPRFILIIESKNISGTLTFDQKHNQLIREVNGKVDGFQDPISQVKHQEYQLKNWLNSKKLPDFAIETCVVITNANTIIKVTGEEKRNTPSIIKSSNIVFEIERLNEIHNHRKKQNKRQLSQLSNIILNLHTQPVLNILNEFNINVNDILSGCFVKVVTLYL
ncbi:NERD domain-containing protein [Metabacillus litoralis]|uniref:nuclease-related domain-containing protein n=1 Tax=Metabacillus litoralis TaxID=152268 RepID=UPI001E5921FA|nr:nuclease-related domain-containing protein [Metabacillus litoralis]UHA62596.1 NERD domain-containing protein [Metabacillus litoralis]